MPYHRRRNSIELVPISLRESAETCPGIVMGKHLGKQCSCDLFSFVWTGGLTGCLCFVCSFVEIAIEAMDQLLLTCHSLNLFVQSYLKVVQLVLESQDADLQVLATMSVRIANCLIY